MTVFSQALADIMSAPGFASEHWLTKRSGGRLRVKAIVGVPSRGELQGDAPMSLDNRFIDLAATTGARTGDLLTVDGVTYSLARSPSPDSLGLSNQWIGAPLALDSGDPISYHADGYPLVTWNGTSWVAA